MSGSLNQNIAPTISFNQIPANIQTPGNYVEIDADYQNVGLLPFPARALIIGQGFTTGTRTINTIYTLYRSDQSAALFGNGSPLDDCVTAWFASNPTIPLDVIDVGPATGATAAAGTVTFAGAATAVQEQWIGVAGNRIGFTISPGDTPTVMATNFIAAVAAYFEQGNSPVTLTSSAGVVTLTAKGAGAWGNEYDVRANPAQGDTTVPGVTVTCVSLTGGTGIPLLTTALALIATIWYTDIQCMFTDTAQSVPALTAALTQRYGAMVCNDSTGWICWEGTQGQLTTDVSGVNSAFLVALGVTHPPQPTWIWSAAMMAAGAQALMNDPARQLRTLPLVGVVAPAKGDRLYQPEQNALLLDGIATWDVDKSGNVIVQRAVSTYTTSPLGVPDQAWQDIMTAKVLTRIRWDWKNYVSLVWPRNKLAMDGTIAAEYDPSVATPKRLKASWAARCQLYERAGWIQNSAVTAAASIFEIDPNNPNQVDAQLNVQIIGNLMITEQQLLFNT